MRKGDLIIGDRGGKAFGNAPGDPLGHQRKGKDGEVTQDMDGDGHHQASLYLIGYCKHDPSHHLNEGNLREGNVREHKHQGTQNKGDEDAPSSKETVEHSPKEDLFCDWPYQSTDKKKRDNLTIVGRQVDFYQFQRVDSGNEHY
jgi:hypothetical protein